MGASADSLTEAVSQLQEAIGAGRGPSEWDSWALAAILVDLGDARSALGQGEQAREAYLKSLEIAERLAQAEPDRADYQLDLVISLVPLGRMNDLEGLQHQRALMILNTMKEAGVLDPADEPMIPALQAMIRDRAQSS